MLAPARAAKELGGTGTHRSSHISTCSTKDVYKRQQQKDEKNEKFHRVESFYGSFERNFSLPENANADAIRCESKDGILTVHIPKTESVKQKPKQITVQ